MVSSRVYEGQFSKTTHFPNEFFVVLYKHCFDFGWVWGPFYGTLGLLWVCWGHLGIILGIEIAKKMFMMAIWWFIVAPWVTFGGSCGRKGNERGPGDQLASPGKCKETAGRPQGDRKETAGMVQGDLEYSSEKSFAPPTLPWRTIFDISLWSKIKALRHLDINLSITPLAKGPANIYIYIYVRMQIHYEICFYSFFHYFSN